MAERGSARPAGGCLDVRLWGKEKGLPSPYPVVCHLLDTAAVFGVLWRDLLGEGMRERVAHALGLTLDESGVVLSFWAGLHDLGKISPPFQAQVPDAYKGVRSDPGYRSAPGAEDERAFRHEMATHWALAQLFASAGYPGAPVGRRPLMRLAVSHQIAQLLGGHHGCFGEVLQSGKLAVANEHQPGLGECGWAEQREAHFVALQRVLGADAVPVRGLPAELAVVVSGLVVVADWLASQTEAIVGRMPGPGWQGTHGELEAHWLRAQAAAPGWVRAAQLGRAKFRAERFDEMFPFRPNPLQEDLVARLPGLVSERGAGLLLVTAPTGDGKTEAALFAASVLGRAAGARGLFFALPTMATADAMLPRVDAFAGSALAGERALTLLHSMAWLSPVYAGKDAGTEGAGAQEGAAEAGSLGGGMSSDPVTATEAGVWLRGAKRGLLAPLGVGTIDQALGGVLPLTHNALRLFGLSDKVFVVDEAHAYGPWMHKLLTRLLEWLGSFRAPVVLLSATLTGRTAASLVDAYRRGAGFLDPSDVEPCYPGWLFTDAGSGQVSTPRSVGSGRTRSLDVSVDRVVWDTEDTPGTVPRAGGRREALRRLLAPVAEEGGTALVCCTTVAEAQRTFRDLRAELPELAASRGGLRLLHSRYPAKIRREITADCEADYGKPRSPEDTEGPRPASVLVATQVVEQSMDLDFDLVVSSLAPLAQLLQRAGRGRRHHRGVKGRPQWAHPEDRPRLAVLEPVDGAGVTCVPRMWGTVYDAGLLHRTALLLRDEAAGVIAVPGDVQRLVDAVYAEDFVDRLDATAREQLRQMDAEREAGEMAEEHLADLVGICAPADVAYDLNRLSRRESGVTEELLTTRLGADSGRVLCVFEQPGGAVSLDSHGVLPLPKAGRHGLTRDALALVMDHVAPVPGRWLRDGTAGFPAPRGWDKQPVLRDVVLLRMRPAPDGSWVCSDGTKTITVSEVGLEAT
ncbi:CRISPR-associated endonuclease Cas3'' [Streptomyces sp. NPDC059096]|uniref:CRISPR-associated endonuclease Cas3'' n=1 Tax=Streptomyces sp. NPDC059096 TaxID=3346727 RepID=UPI0036C01505